MSAETRGLVVVNNEVQLQPCTLYKHNPSAATECAILERHHVCPDSWWIAAGKNPNLSPFRDLCPTCHMNTHAAIDAIIKKQITDLLPPRTYQLALDAFAIAEANGLTPALTL